MADEASENRRKITDADELLAIDLSLYDELTAYSNDGKDWQLERDKLLFLQTAARLEIPWDVIVERTIPHFGNVLNPPFEAVVAPLDFPPFNPPAFDSARQNPDEWAREADAAWRTFRDDALSQIWQQYDAIIGAEKLKPFERRRKTVSGRKKAPIIDEQTGYEMAVLWFFLPLSWKELALSNFPPPAGYAGKDIASQVQRRADQIRIRVQGILEHLNLPTRK